jgi:chromosome partitioning protein
VKVWAVSNQKGGVGKTTTAVSLGGLLAEQGFKVLLLDLDPHGSMTSYFGYDPEDTGLTTTYHFFEMTSTATKSDVLTCVKSTGVPELSFIPASTALATLERQMVGKSGMGLKVNQALGLVSQDFDYVIIDSPPVLGVLMINALAACHLLLVPVQTEFLAIKGLERMLRTCEMVVKSQQKSFDYLIIPTMFDRRTHASTASLRELRNTYQDTIWPSMIPIDTRFRDASQAGLPISLFDSNTRGTEAYRSLLKFLSQAKKSAA